MNEQTKEFGVYHWDTFDNETMFVEEFDTFQEAEDFRLDKYRVRDDGADWVHIFGLDGTKRGYPIG